MNTRAIVLVGCILSILVLGMVWLLVSIQISIKALLVKIDQIDTAQAQANAILHRVVGKDVPVKAPEDATKKLLAIEARLADKEKWPRSLGESEQLRDELGNLIGGLPVWVEDALLPRLLPLRWSVTALLLLHAPKGTSVSELEKREDDLKELLEKQPEKAPAELKARIEKNVKECAGALPGKRREEAVKQAYQALESGKRDENSLSSAWSLLGSFADGDKEVGKLRTQLRRSIQEQSIDKRIVMVEDTLNRVQTGLKEDRLRQGGLARVHDAASGLLLDLETESPRPEKFLERVNRLLLTCEAEQRDIAKRGQERAARSFRDYQAWALKEIQWVEQWTYETTRPWVAEELKKFRTASEELDWIVLKRFPLTKELLEKKLEISLSGVKGSVLTAEQQQEIYKAAAEKFGWKNKIDNELAYRIARDAMVQGLLPINQNLLEPPVLRLYQKAWEKGWTSLEGREDQLELAKQAAVTAKKQPD